MCIVFGIILDETLPWNTNTRLDFYFQKTWKITGSVSIFRPHFKHTIMTSTQKFNP